MAIDLFVGGVVDDSKVGAGRKTTVRVEKTTPLSVSQNSLVFVVVCLLLIDCVCLFVCLNFSS